MEKPKKTESTGLTRPGFMKASGVALGGLGFGGALVGPRVGRLRQRLDEFRELLTHATSGLWVPLQPDKARSAAHARQAFPGGRRHGCVCPEERPGLLPEEPADIRSGYHLVLAPHGDQDVQG